jgi:hypothetical protein
MPSVPNSEERRFLRVDDRAAQHRLHLTAITTIIILLMSVTLSSCAQKESIADSFVEYDSTEFITENSNLSDRIPVFSVKYPPDWEYAWVGDSGVIALLISSGDAEAAWLGQDHSGATMMIIPIPYSGEELTDLFYSTLDAGKALEPSTTTIINGQDAARAEYTRKENLFIEVVIARENWALPIVSYFPTEKETEFRPLIEAIITTIEIR